MYVCAAIKSDYVTNTSLAGEHNVQSHPISQSHISEALNIGRNKNENPTPTKYNPIYSVCVVRTFPHHGKSPSNPLKTLSMWNTHIFIIVSAICMEVSEVRSLIDDLSSQLSSWLHTMN